MFLKQDRKHPKLRLIQQNVERNISIKQKRKRFL